MITSPLRRLTEKDATFRWSDECEMAFEKLKDLLTNAPILAYPLPDIKLSLDTDACQFGIGAILSQEQNGPERVIAYFSRSLSRAEKNYCVTRKELLAVVKAVEKFHYYLYGRRFVIRTDHSSLRWLLRFRQPEGQIARWMQKLQQYDFEIIHRPGRTNSNTDALSWRPCYSSECVYCERLEEKEVPNDENLMKIARNATTEEKSSLKIWTREKLISLQNTDSDIGPIFHWKIKKKRTEWGDVAACSATTKAYWAQWDSLEVVDGILYHRREDAEGHQAKNLLLAPKSIWNEILQHLHNPSTAGHLGIKKKVARVRERFYWLNSRKFVKNYCKRCDECSSRKGLQKKWEAPLKLYQVGSPTNG